VSPQPDLARVSVIIPVYGQRDILEAHIQQHEPLYKKSGQTIWVATPSSDQAQQLAQQAANRLGGKYLEIGPGLYRAWNTAISHANQDWIYLNTVGDFCDPEALRKLLEMAAVAGAEVAFTPPRGSRTDPGFRNWPLVQHAAMLDAHEGKIIPKSAMVRLQIQAGDCNLLGSLAGALFSSRCLNRSPFRTDFKSFGDTAWTYEYCARVSFLYSSISVASFLFHDSLRPAIHPRDTHRLLNLLAGQLPPHRQPEAKKQIRRYILFRRILNRIRGARPNSSWLVSPAAWLLRWRRIRAFATMSCFLEQSFPASQDP